MCGNSTRSGPCVDSRRVAFANTTAAYGRTTADTMNTHLNHPSTRRTSGRHMIRIAIIVRYCRCRPRISVLSPSDAVVTDVTSFRRQNLTHSP